MSSLKIERLLKVWAHKELSYQSHHSSILSCEWSLTMYSLHPTSPTPAQTTRSISQGSASIANAINQSSSTRSFVDGLLASSLSLVLLIPVFLETSDRLIDFRERNSPNSVIYSAFLIRKIVGMKMYSDFLNSQFAFCPIFSMFVLKIGIIHLKT